MQVLFSGGSWHPLLYKSFGGDSGVWFPRGLQPRICAALAHRVDMRPHRCLPPRLNQPSENYRRCLTLKSKSCHFLSAWTDHPNIYLDFKLLCN